MKEGKVLCQECGKKFSRPKEWVCGQCKKTYATEKEAFSCWLSHGSKGAKRVIENDACI